MEQWQKPTGPETATSTVGGHIPASVPDPVLSHPHGLRRVARTADGAKPFRLAIAPRLVSLKDATSFLGGKHPSRFGAKPVCPGRDSVWDLFELNALLNKRLVDMGLVALDSAPQGTAANDEADELTSLWNKLEAPPRL